VLGAFGFMIVVGTFWTSSQEAWWAATFYVTGLGLLVAAALWLAIILIAVVRGVRRLHS